MPHVAREEAAEGRWVRWGPHHGTARSRQSEDILAPCGCPLDWYTAMALPSIVMAFWLWEKLQASPRLHFPRKKALHSSFLRLVGSALLLPLPRPPPLPPPPF